MLDDEMFWCEVEEALRADEVDEVAMWILDEVCNEGSLFKLHGMQLAVEKSPLAQHPGIEEALNRQIDRVKREAQT